MATATEDMGVQVDTNDGYAISLSSLWRAVGCPAGRDPRSWVELARPLIEGGAAYFARVPTVPSDLFTEPQTWEFRRETGEEIDLHWEGGDVMARQWVAQYYADYLDTEADESEAAARRRQG